jgi:hypothetical protein
MLQVSFTSHISWYSRKYRLDKEETKNRSELIFRSLRTWRRELQGRRWGCPQAGKVVLFAGSE